MLAALGTRVVSAGELTEWKGPPAAPPIDLYTADGSRLTLETLRGKAVLVNFWATWCEPCVREMPSLQRLRDQLQPKLEVLGVNFKERPGKIKAFVDKASIRFPIVLDTDGAVAKAWGARIFPTTYVVDPTGIIRRDLVGGADWTSLTVANAVKSFL